MYRLSLILAFITSLAASEDSREGSVDPCFPYRTPVASARTNPSYIAGTSAPTYSTSYATSDGPEDPERLHQIAL